MNARREQSELDFVPLATPSLLTTRYCDGRLVTTSRASLILTEPPAKRARLELAEPDLLAGLGDEDLLFSDEIEPELRGDAEVPAEEYDEFGLDAEEIDWIGAEEGSELLGVTEDIPVAADITTQGRDLWELTSNSASQRTASQRTAVASQAHQSPTAGSPPDEHYTPAAPMADVPVDLSLGGFSFGLTRRAAAPTSEAARKRAQAVLEGITGDELLTRPERRGSSREASPAPAKDDDVFGAVRPAANRPARHPLAQMTVVADDSPTQPNSSPTASRDGQTLVASQEKSLSQQAMPPPAVPSPAVRATTPFRPAVNGQPKSTTAFRPPFAARVASPLSTPSNASPRTSTPRRLQLGMSPKPRLTQRTETRPSFSTPFRNGKVPEVLDSALVRSPRPSPAVSAPVTPTVQRPPRTGLMSVFDLTCSEPRYGMQAAGLRPPRCVDDCLVNYPPNELVFMDFDRAASTQFDGKGPEQAFERLKQAGATYGGIDLAWIRDHWQLIVWKLAAIGRAKPEDWRKTFTFDNVVDQLLYRYEREVNLAHRSAIKRIQEMDSSPGQPMVLCVTAINWIDPAHLPKPEVDGKTGHVEQGPLLTDIEVTDGWYRMRAAVDRTIGRACVAHKIRSGVKLIVARASLTSVNGRPGRPLEGTDVMNAHDTTALQLNGNATSLARWDAKLGFQGPSAPQYISTLRALLPDGGVVPLVDVVVTRVYPLGYSEAKTEENPNPAPWTAAEEGQKQREWEQARESAYERASAELESGIEKASEVADRIDRAADNARATGAITTQDALEGESALHDFDDAEDKAAFLRSLSAKTLRVTAQAAQERVIQLKEAARDQVTDLVEKLVPRRRITRFCCIRVIDYHETDRSDIKREALLTVWNWDDISQTTTVKEDARFQIHNLRPNRLTAWAKPRSMEGEIFLTSFSASRWIAKPNV